MSAKTGATSVRELGVRKVDAYKQEREVDRALQTKLVRAISRRRQFPI